jgi:hypothetical protein
MPAEIIVRILLFTLHLDIINYFVCTDLITLKETCHEIFNFRFFSQISQRPQ